MAASKQQVAAVGIMLVAVVLGPLAAGQLLSGLPEIIQLKCYVGWDSVPGAIICPLVARVFPVAKNPPTGYGLSEDHYYQSNSYCPNAEELVRQAVVNGTIGKNDTGLNAGLIRLHFHDAFVRGCDASVLLDITADKNNDTEKTAPPNNNSLRGFEVIEAAKKAVHDACPGIVSCADILAMAARDASYILSNYTISYKVLLGRLDGTRSLADETNQLPGPGSSLQQLKDSFAAQGLTTQDMVTLSGAHTVGHARCMFATRLAQMDPNCASIAKAICAAGDGSKTVPQDYKTPDVLDNQYYKNIAKCVLFPSDAALIDSNETTAQVNDYAADNGHWGTYYGEAMRKMGSIGVTTQPRSGFEIRTVCSKINGAY